MSSHLTRLVLAIKSVETDETLERWQFDIHTEDGPSSAGALPGAPKPAAKKKNKTEKEVQAEIQGIMKQITSSVTFLPILDEECECTTSWAAAQDQARRIKLDGRPHFHIEPPSLTPTGTFTILAYTDDAPDTAIPSTWDDADPHLIDRGKVEQVRLRSFTTNVHSLEAMVAYRVGE